MSERTAMTTEKSHDPQGQIGGASRPPMRPATGVRRVKLSPHELVDAVTATEDLFVLAHLGVPQVDPERWSLTIDGLVGRSQTLTFDDLKAQPKRIVEAVHQCCGNPLEPTTPTRRVTNVRWGGVDLAALLAGLEIDSGARFLWSYGLDGGVFAGTTCDWFIKDLPLERLAAGDVLIAYELNGEPLTAEHGFPARLVVPGYYGTNSVKWLWRLRVAEHRAEVPFTTTFYNDSASAADRAAGTPLQRPVWGIAPESLIVAPAPNMVVGVSNPVEIWGWAWSFRGVDVVEVSVDGGASYVRAALERRRGWAWQRFALTWTPVERGEASLQVRAIDANGTGQPQAGARNATHTVRVFVR
jgi:DMSO/TMAO reductase YedYZ molybdopterin-dependent catalytic subunit